MQWAQARCDGGQPGLQHGLLAHGDTRSRGAGRSDRGHRASAQQERPAPHRSLQFWRRLERLRRSADSDHRAQPTGQETPPRLSDRLALRLPRPAASENCVTRAHLVRQRTAMGTHVVGARLDSGTIAARMGRRLNSHCPLAGRWSGTRGTTDQQQPFSLAAARLGEFAANRPHEARCGTRASRLEEDASGQDAGSSEELPTSPLPTRAARGVLSSLACRGTEDSQSIPRGWATSTHARHRASRLIRGEIARMRGRNRVSVQKRSVSGGASGVSSESVLVSQNSGEKPSSKALVPCCGRRTTSARLARVIAT